MFFCNVGVAGMVSQPRAQVISLFMQGDRLPYILFQGQNQRAVLKARGSSHCARKPVAELAKLELNMADCLYIFLQECCIPTTYLGYAPTGNGMHVLDSEYLCSIRVTACGSQEYFDRYPEAYQAHGWLVVPDVELLHRDYPGWVFRYSQEDRVFCAYQEQANMMECKPERFFQMDELFPTGVFDEDWSLPDNLPHFLGQITTQVTAAFSNLSNLLIDEYLLKSMTFEVGACRGPDFQEGDQSPVHTWTEPMIMGLLGPAVWECDKKGVSGDTGLLPCDSSITLEDALVRYGELLSYLQRRIHDVE